MSIPGVMCMCVPPPPPGFSPDQNESNHLEERLLDQAQARASYTPPFLGSFV